MTGTSAVSRNSGTVECSIGGRGTSVIGTGFLPSSVSPRTVCKHVVLIRGGFTRGVGGNEPLNEGIVEVRVSPSRRRDLS